MSTTVTKPKHRRVLGWKNRSSGDLGVAKSKLRWVLGSQNRTSGELRGRLGVGPGGFWAGSGTFRGVRGGPPRNFGVDFFPRQKQVPDKFFDHFYDLFSFLKQILPLIIFRKC